MNSTEADDLPYCFSMLKNNKFQDLLCKVDSTVLSAKECAAKLCTKSTSVIFFWLKFWQKIIRVFLFPFKAFYCFILWSSPFIVANRIHNLSFFM